jgi:hypothetical protein
MISYDTRQEARDHESYKWPQLEIAMPPECTHSQLLLMLASASFLAKISDGQSSVNFLYGKVS